MLGWVIIMMKFRYSFRSWLARHVYHHTLDTSHTTMTSSSDDDRDLKMAELATEEQLPEVSKLPSFLLHFPTLFLI